MFCPKCGADSQSPESYCKRCGDWLPDLEALKRPGIFRKLSRQEKIRKMRVLQAVSAGLSLTSAAIILAILAGGGDTQILFLAAFCSILVAAYQIVNFYLGYKIEQKSNRSHSEAIKENSALETGKKVEMLDSAQANSFVSSPGVTEHTTELLEPVPRRTERNK
jgi:hypothetical protein